MLHDPSRHEPLQAIAWDEQRVLSAIAHIVQTSRAAFDADRYWPPHPRDFEPGDDPTQRATCLYYGAAGVAWALQHLQAVGAVDPDDQPPWPGPDLVQLLAHNRAWLMAGGLQRFESYLMGDTPILMLMCAQGPNADAEDRLAALIEANIDHPARELMWGSPGTLLAALFMHQLTGQARWADLFRATAARLWQQLLWSPEHQCHYWLQDLYGQQSTYIDGVHGFVATASPLIRGRALLAPSDWAAWAACIENTVSRSATREDGLANWRAQLLTKPGSTQKVLMQFCHGAPGFVICLGDLPGNALDGLLLEAGQAIWQAGPLTKGANLCHGTGGNGCAFLKLYQRTGDAVWLDRARAFAMHAIAQMEAEAAQHGGRLRHSLWTGDEGLALYLWDCIRGRGEFPTLDVFFAAPRQGCQRDGAVAASATGAGAASSIGGPT
jgi:hypothetical protein